MSPTIQSLERLLITQAHEAKTWYQIMFFQLDSLSLQLKRDERINPEIYERRIESIVQSIRILNNLNDNISELYNSTGHRSTQVVDFHVIVNDVINLFAYKVQTRDVKSEIVNNLKGIPLITMNESYALQLVTNIIDNAINAATDKLRIRIHYELRKDSNGAKILALDFEDYGVGVDAQETDQIFDLGRVGLNTVHSRPTSTGIGLAVVRSILSRMGSKIYVSSSANPTVFSVEFPEALYSENHKT